MSGTKAYPPVSEEDYRKELQKFNEGQEEKKTKPKKKPRSPEQKKRDPKPKKKKSMVATNDETTDLLKDPDLLNKLAELLDPMIPKNHNQKKLFFLILGSSYIDTERTNFERLHTILNSSSSSGKSYFLKTFKGLLSEEKMEHHSRISPKALDYYKTEDTDPEWTWDNKLLGLEDVGPDVVNSSSLKVFLSDGASTLTVDKGKSKRHCVRGIPTVLMTMCVPIPQDEMLTRVLLINLEETTERFKQALKSISREYSGAMRDVPELSLLRNTFSMIKNREVKAVHIPFAEKIDQYFPAEARSLRDYKRFNTLMMASVILHQSKRRPNEYGELVAEKQDYEVAKEMLEFIAEGGDFELTHIQKKALKCVEECIETKKKNGTMEPLNREMEPSNLTTYLDTTTNSSMVPSVPSVCARDLFAQFPVRNEKSWIKILERLAAKGFLSVSSRTNPATSRECTYYHIIARKNPYKLPEYENILTRLNDGTMEPSA